MHKGVSNEHDTQMAFPDLLQDKVAEAAASLGQTLCGFCLVFCEWNQDQWICSTSQDVSVICAFNVGEKNLN